MKNNSQNGFTLIETLIYGLLVSGMILAATTFSLNVSEGNERARAYQEVQQNARMAMERIVQEIRSAGDLNSGGSTFGSNPGVLSLSHNYPAKNPTIFDISGEKLRISQAGAATTTLTSDLVRVTNLTFTNLSVSSRTKNIGISLTVEHVNPGNNDIYAASTTIETSAVIRNQSDLP